MTRFQRNLWIGLILMALLSPLGILLPGRFHAEDAWGEWGMNTIEKLLGYVPQGLKKYSELWKAPIPDYNFCSENASMTFQIVSYMISGFLGILATALIVFLISRFLIKHEK